MEYLVDTTWIIDYLRGNPDVEMELRSFRRQGLAMSIVSLAELYEGVYRSRNPSENEASLTEFLDQVGLLQLNEEICKVFGRERAYLRSKGSPVGDIDLMIVSTALYYDLTLLTADSDFERVRGLRITYLPR